MALDGAADPASFLACNHLSMTTRPTASDFNSPSNEEQRETATRLWESQFPGLDTLREMLVGPYMRIDPTSSLGLDARYLGSWGGGSLQQSALVASHSALTTARTVLETGSLPTTGLYPLFRTAVESASLAIYLVSPVSRDVRLERLYRIAAEESRLRKNHHLEFHSPHAYAIHEETLADLRTLIALRPSLGEPDALLVRAASNSEIVKQAGIVIAAHPSTTNDARAPLLSIWQALSGLSHAKHWAMLQYLSRSGAVLDGSPNRATVEMSSDAATIAYMMNQSAEALEVALRLYGERSSATHALAEDALEPRPDRSEHGVD